MKAQSKGPTGADAGRGPDRAAGRRGVPCRSADQVAAETPALSPARLKRLSRKWSSPGRGCATPDPWARH